jgi:hypothetical protein
MIYLTAIRLTPGGSSTVRIYTQTIHRTKIYIEQPIGKRAGRVRSLRIIPWHLPYKSGKSMENPQSECVDFVKIFNFSTTYSCWHIINVSVEWKLFTFSISCFGSHLWRAALYITKFLNFFFFILAGSRNISSNCVSFHRKYAKTKFSTPL